MCIVVFVDKAVYKGILFDVNLRPNFDRICVQACHYEGAYWGERRGRARVEREMKKLAEVQLNTEVSAVSRSAVL